jgi:hypothetical protein
LLLKYLAVLYTENDAKMQNREREREGGREGGREREKESRMCN